MSVMVKVTSTQPATYGEVLDMPTASILVVKTKFGTFKVHESCIRKFF